MPVYQFECPDCGAGIKQLIKTDTIKRIYCQCGKFMERKLPTSISTVAMETKDSQRGKSLPKGHKEMMTKRMNQHHDKYEAEKKIDEFGVDDAKRLGWDRKVKRV